MLSLTQKNLFLSGHTKKEESEISSLGLEATWGLKRVLALLSLSSSAIKLVKIIILRANTYAHLFLALYLPNNTIKVGTCPAWIFFGQLDTRQSHLRGTSIGKMPP